MSNTQNAADQDHSVDSAGGPGVVDWTSLRELAAAFGPAAPTHIAECIGLFRDSAPDLLRQVAAALDGPDIRAAAAPAHALIGAAGMLGARRLATAAQRIQTAAKNTAPVVELRLLLRRAAAELTHVEDALDHLPADLR